MYKIVLLDQLGNEIVPLTGVVSLSASRSLNTIGAATISLLGKDISPLLNYDYRIAIYRNDYLLGSTHWLIKERTKTIDGWNIECKDTLSIPNDRIVAYARETTFSEKTIEYGNNGAADDLMKAFMRENLGSLATDTSRDLSAYLTIEPDLALGPTVEKSASQQNVFSVMSSIANDSRNNGVDLYFDIIPRTNDLFFYVRDSYLNDDRGQLTFSPQNNNLQNEDISWNYADEKTSIYIGGYGRGASQIIRNVVDASRASRSPFGIRETSINRSDIDVDSVLDREGESALGEFRAKQTLTGGVVENDNTIFGRDFKYGDLVTMAIGDVSAQAVVRAFSVSVDNGQESLDIRLEGINLI